ncbi:peptide ligase PGM1-related protein [Streptomyces sp. NPDC048057]|uniref:peptide ligase PGM1-related protein n=1 Tax=Streptomyces sp. NPDC048057 TaxID=3155628 RepID=UPI0033C9FE6B
MISGLLSTQWDTTNGQQCQQTFEQLQQRLPALFARRGGAATTAVVVPSLSLDGAELRKIKGVIHFEERLLFLAQVLRDPDARLLYVTSLPLRPVVVDNALGAVSSLPAGHALRRLTLLDCADGSPVPLTEKVLKDDALVQRILSAIPDRDQAYLVTFNSTPLERALAVRLGIPLYACDPALAQIGTKSGGRQLLRSAGVPVPEGFEDIRDEQALVKALAELRGGNPGCERAVVKLDDSFAGCGNAVFPFAGAPAANLESWIRAQLPRRLSFAAQADTWQSYGARLREMGGIVERFVDAPGTRSPSVQLEIEPVRGARVVSTHEQVLGGSAGQVFTGCVFPAGPGYRAEIQRLALLAGRALAAKGVLGHLSIDFLVEDPTRTVPSDGPAPAEGIHALEINLRMGGATAPFFLMHGAVEGAYAQDTGEYLTPEGEPRCYVATDRAQRDGFERLQPEDVVDVALRNGLHYRQTTRTGAVFYVLGALPGNGKLGVVAVERTVERAQSLYDTLLARVEAAGRRRA